MNELVAQTLVRTIIVQAQLNQSRDITDARQDSVNIDGPQSENLPIANILGINDETISIVDDFYNGRQKFSTGTLPIDKIPVVGKRQIVEITKTDQNWIDLVEAITGVESASKKRVDLEARTKRLQSIRFLKMLISSDRALRSFLPKAYNDNVSLFVQHTMDMGPTYAQRADGRDFWDYSQVQLPRVRSLDGSFTNGTPRYIHFAAFSPFRATEIERTSASTIWKSSTPIQQIASAISNGAWGVKYYPPAGYRASGNDIPRRPFFKPTLRNQWDYRYKGFSDEKLDALNLAFFEYCAENDIPVFAHCNYGEFQAAKGYGERMAHPKYYRTILENLRNRPKPLHLRLCFAHAGGADFWFGKKNSCYSDWGKEVYDLCTEFPNVYCEVGILSEIANEDGRKVFSERLVELFNASQASGKYPFSSKLLYGTDWFMPDAVALGVDFLSAYKTMFDSNPDLAKHSREFFCQNALSYLGLYPVAGLPTNAQRDQIRQSLLPLVENARR